ncbi:hypothetical protein PR048_028794 [Dryococelus australis]|uniref:Transposase n=1 Tax=Dryococelus australis TaxID=614101 RepID=A0ABQ9GE36_9NEOP|nr:hypothetical protein PR048_028794 [Dryococelus australis]
MSPSNAVKCASKAIGCSERTIYVLGAELQQHRNLSTPGIVKPKRKGKQTHFFVSIIPPTLNAILAKVNSDESLPDFSCSTLHRFLHDIGFGFLRRGNKVAFIERDDIIPWRHTYLREVKRFRGLGKPIIFTNELWVNVGLSVKKACKDTTVKST